MSLPKKRKRFFTIIIFLLVVIGLCFIITDLPKITKNERLEGVWIVQGKEDIYLLTISNALLGKGYTRAYYIRLIDPEMGKIEHKKVIEAKSYDNVELKCMTPTSLWVKKREGWICLEFPSLKTRWTQPEFYSYLKNTYSAVGEPFKMELYKDSFEVVNKVGEKFRFSPFQFENGPVKVHLPQNCFLFNDQNQIGHLLNYTIPGSKKQPVIEINIESDKSGQVIYYPGMPLDEKLKSDTGFAKTYAVFTTDSICLLSDGNDRRIIKKLINDSLSLEWTPLFNNRVWLKGDFLRPYKEYNRPPDNRFIVSYKDLLFVHYQTSLDKKDNRSHLSGVNIKTEKVIWDLDLSVSKITLENQPIQSYVLKDLLLMVWENNNHQAMLMGIDAATGALKWKIDK